MKLIETLYAHLVKGDFSSFCKVYEKVIPERVCYSHDKLISTAYLSQKLALTDKRYEKFVDFLLDKKTTAQLVGLLIAQNNNEKAGFYYKKLIYQESNKKTENEKVLLNVIIQSKNINFLVEFIDHFNLEKMLTQVLQSDFKEAQLKVMDWLPVNEKNTKLILSIFLHLVKNNEKSFDYEPYAHYLKKQVVEKDFLFNLVKSIKMPSLWYQAFHLARKSGSLEDILAINYFLGEKENIETQWYNKIFLSSEELVLDNNDDVINKMYSHIYLNKILVEKTEKKLTNKI